ncbi:hypothetical protein F53441_5054 [Fusarium austroafricanum]|uniref:Uncharacterized protein n=1 Tax=Fusarium austroafricanum TaxID=2364996 RepID=A0A8H4P125_9HYPO|nr:hypothetical protein F53441_5054 [Fusarium austroafricanum]
MGSNTKSIETTNKLEITLKEKLASSAKGPSVSDSGTHFELGHDTSLPPTVNYGPVPNFIFFPFADITVQSDVTQQVLAPPNLARSRPANVPTESLFQLDNIEVVKLISCAHRYGWMRLGTFNEGPFMSPEFLESFLKNVFHCWFSEIGETTTPKIALSSKKLTHVKAGRFNAGLPADGGFQTGP